MITPQAAINRLIDQNELFYDEMLDLMQQIMRGEITPTLTAAILIGLRVKVETVQEIAAAATAIRKFSHCVPVNDRRYLVDTCGTGGDHCGTFNISTTAAFVAAAAGARVAKHGNRSISSNSGSADVLEHLGLNLALTPEQVGQCIDRIGIGFMFAPNHHYAMKHVNTVRQELGVRTLFNILGPLTNPAKADNQLVGVFHADLVGIQARVLKELGSRHVMVVHGCDGLDEITVSGPTMVAELKNGKIHEYQIRPEQFGIEIAEVKTLHAVTVEQSQDILLSVLAGNSGPATNIVILNAGAAIYTAGIAPSLADGIHHARAVIQDGLARQKLTELQELTRSFPL